MAVAFEELDNSPRQTVSQEGWTGTREFKILWSDIDAFIVELLGQTHRIQGNVQNINPSGFPNRPLAVCTSVDIGPFIAAPAGAQVTLTGVANTFTYARIIATYSLKPRAFQTPDGTFMTWDQDHAVEVMMTPGRNWKFDGVGEGEDPDLGEDQPFPIHIGVTNHSLKWERVAAPPWSAIQASRGTLNAGLYLGAIPGSLLFKGARSTTTFDVVGQVRYNLEYSFVEKTVQSTVSNSVTNASGSPITFTIGTHNIEAGEYVQVTGVRGNQNANGIFLVDSADGTSITVDGVASKGAYTGGGTVRKVYPQWNYFWREQPDSNGEHWFKIADAETDEPPYADTDFSGLFEYGARLGGELIQVG